MTNADKLREAAKEMRHLSSLVHTIAMSELASERALDLERIADPLDAIPPETGKWVEMPEWRRWILKQEGLSEWKIEDSVDAMCWVEQKTIQIPPDATPTLFLHEVAHALYQELEGPLLNHYHGGCWADAFGRLVNKYMVVKMGTESAVPPETLAAIKAGTWQAVPRSPTTEMLWSPAKEMIGVECSRIVYKHMLTAAPKKPEEP